MEQETLELSNPDSATEPKRAVSAAASPSAGNVEEEEEPAVVVAVPEASSSAPAQPVLPSEKQHQVPSAIHVTTSTLANPKKSKPAPSLEEANNEIAALLESGKVSMEQVNGLQGVLRQHVALQEKVTKLKSLLGRSAKAQRESKMELEGTQRKLEQALHRVDMLTKKVDHLATRPTHMDLLADFETNFDRALLSVAPHHQQSGGQDSSSSNPNAETISGSSGEPVLSSSDASSSLVMDGMLMQELNESKNRVERLESLNSALLHRSSLLEQNAKEFKKERDGLQQSLSQLQLELKMAQMEATHATRALHDKESSLKEMQMEIDLVTKANVSAQVRAQKEKQAAKSIQTDREHVLHLEAQVAALQEWATASAEAKRLAQERVDILERQLKILQRVPQEDDSGGGRRRGRLLFRQVNSLVIGAGDVGFKIFENNSMELAKGERALLKWKFDLTPSDQSILFNVIRGKCESSPEKQPVGAFLIKDRLVTGGAAGETGGAFEVDSACTLLWSNKSSWVRPRTVKYEVEVVAVLD